MFDNFFNDREDVLKKREKKNKLHELLDKYGSVEGIEKNAAGADGNAIFYRDYYKWNGINKLPYKIRGFIVDFGVCSQPLTAIRMTHRVLGIPEGNIIGKTTLDKFKQFTQKDYEDFLEKYRAEMIKYYNKVVKVAPEKKKYLQGWINRANRAHLSD